VAGPAWPEACMIRALALLVPLLLAAPAAAADYWVKNGGDDGADGLSVGTAWATLGHAADVVDPGDTVHVLDGSYQGFYLDRSGLPGQPITFVAAGSAALITADNGTTPDGINLEGASHVVIDGFVVNDRSRTGVRTVTAQDVTIRNCRLGHNGRWGILTGFVDDLVIEDNEAYDSQVEHGIYVSNSGDRPIVRRNLVYGNHANGIHMNGDESQGGDGIISDALVERNVIHGNGAGGGSGINMDGVVDSVVRNNLLYDNHASGVSLYRIDGATGSTGNLVVNNTIVNAADGRWAVNISGGSTGNTIVNNVLYTAHAFRGTVTADASSLPGLVSDHNVVMDRFSTDGGDTVITLAAWQALGHDLDSVIATPADVFLAPGIDFHLKPGSPALDLGILAGAPSEDLDGHPRPVGTAVDAGAYETQLLECGDGGIDPGEECGEPGLGSCADPCSTCSGCTCAPAPPTCGDGHVCGSEACEMDADCGGGQVCQGCACVNAPACTSGIDVARPVLKLRASPLLVRFRGDAVLGAVDPATSGVRVVVDAASGSGGFDAVISGGSGWTTNATTTRWRYRDPTGTLAGITKIVVRDRSTVAPGLVRWVVKGKTGGSLTLPDVAGVRAAFVVGGACAGHTWNGPGGPSPRCEGGAARLTCR
jgi:hypothetical protein